MILEIFCFLPFLKKVKGDIQVLSSIFIPIDCFFSPFSNIVFVLNPISFSAFEVSSILRGWPSGFYESQITFPLNPVNFEMSSTSSFIVISKPAPRFTGSGLSYLFAASIIASAASST